MPLYIKEDDVDSLVDVKDAIAALEEGFRHWRRDGTENRPRQRLPLPAPARALNIMAASSPSLGLCGLKAYFGGCHHVLLHSLEERRLLAVIEAGRLGAIRTGAASGVATRYLARDDASVVGIVGTGRQARTQLAAVAAVRPVRIARVFGRDAGRRQAFAAEMADALSCEVVPCDTAEDCVRDAQIVIAATNSAEPVVFGDWLAPGTHVNAVGANGYARRELDDAAVVHAALVVTDDRDQARTEARELIDLARDGRLDWDDVVELGDLVQHNHPGRKNARDITLFKSLGIALEDIAFGKVIYDRAVASGRGVDIR